MLQACQITLKILQTPTTRLGCAVGGMTGYKFFPHLSVPPSGLAGAPPALGAAAATATPLPTLPMTESGAYLPMTSGGWILRGWIQQMEGFLDVSIQRDKFQDVSRCVN